MRNRRVSRNGIPLHSATRRKSIDEIMAILNSDADVNATNSEGRTALHIAATFYVVDIFRLIFEHGGDINARDIDHVTPLHVATRGGRIDIVKFILQNGGDVNAKLADTHETALHVATSEALHFLLPDIINLIVRNGGDVNAKDHCGITPLHIASTNGNKRLIELLLRNGANVNANCIYGRSVMHYALESGKPAVLDLIFEHCGDLNYLYRNNVSLLDRAISLGKIKMVKWIFKKGADPNQMFDNNDNFESFTHESVSVPVRNLVIKYLAQINASEKSLAALRKRAEISEYFDECMQELERMKSERIWRSLSVYDLLTKSPDRFMFCVTAVDRTKFSEKFPIYCDDLRENFRRATQKKSLFSSAETMLTAFFDEKRIPNVVVRMILKLLGDEDKTNFMEASTIQIVGQKRKRVSEEEPKCMKQFRK